jgi:anti-anti-sigma factor
MISYEAHEVTPGHIELRLSGELVIGAETAKVRACLSPLVEKFAQVTVDLKSLRRIDSTGIGVLVMAYAKARNHGHRLLATNVGGTVRDTLLLVKLLAVLDPECMTPQAA